MSKLVAYVFFLRILLICQSFLITYCYARMTPL